MALGNVVDLGIRITSDVSGGVAGISQTEGALSKVKGVALGVAAAVGAALVATGAYAVDAIGAAGDLEQSIGAIDTVFKGSSDQIHGWAKSAAQDVGLTQNEFNELGTLIGTQLKNGGTAMDQLAPKTKDLIGLGADLSSMFGGTSKEAVEALSSALKGERDPIERYGVSLKQASIDAKAAELGFAKVGGALTDEAQQAATLALIMEQTADAHGNFAKEADTLQGKQARFAATLENVKTTIGTALLPIATQFFGYLNDVAGPAVSAIADRFAGWVESVDLGGWWERLTGGVETATGALSGIQPVIDGVVGWFTGSLLPVIEQLASAIQDRFTASAAIVQDFAAGLWTHIEPLLPQIQAVFQGIGEIVVGAVELLTAAWDTGTQFLLAAWEIVGPPIIDTVGGIMAAVIGVVGPAIDFVKSIISTALAVIRGDWSGAWEGVKSILSNAWNLIKSIVSGAVGVVKSVISGAVQTIKNLWSSAWSAIGDKVTGAWDGIKSAVRAGIDTVVDWFVGLPGRMVSALSGAAGQLRNVGRNIIDGLIGGIKGMATKALDSVRGVVTGAIDGAKRLLGIKSPSRVFFGIGTQTVQGFRNALDAGRQTVADAGRRMIDAAIPDQAPRIDLDVNGRRAAAAGGGPVIMINVHDAYDPDATARKLRDLFTRDARIRGTVELNGVAFA